MLPITQLSLKNFRTHDDYVVDFTSPTTVIIGPNGSGKTSLIEAIYIALQGSSFKATDNDILRRDESWYRVDLGFFGDTRTVKYDPSRTSGKKQFVVEEKIHYRLPHARRYPVVLFEPDDLRLANGSPARRREFIDRLIRQIDAGYDQDLRNYERALKQRNNLLKQTLSTQPNLFVWDVALSKYGANIIAKRQHYIDRLNRVLTMKYQTIARNDDIVTISYTQPSIGNSEQYLLNQLHKNHQKDALLGYTSTGPHRDDLVILLNGTPALHRASRGEIRTIVLALKMCEADLIVETLGKKPIILLDDVFSELDEARQKNLTQVPLEQLIITSTGYLNESEHNSSVIQL